MDMKLLYCRIEQINKYIVDNENLVPYSTVIRSSYEYEKGEGLK